MFRTRTDVVRLQEQRVSDQRALVLQAAEYDDHLERLNHENARVATVQANSVTQESFDQYVKNESEKRDLALARVDEKLVEIAREAERKSNRNLAILALVTTIGVGVANGAGPF